jgi:hypothetical protein
MKDFKNSNKIEMTKRREKGKQRKGEIMYFQKNWI